MIVRRALLKNGAAAAALAAWSPARAQQGRKPPVVGFLNGASPDPYRDVVRAFTDGLAQQGFVAGQSVEIAFAFAENDAARLPGLTAGLLASKVDVIVTSGGELPLIAAKTATRTTPIVSIFGRDPVEAGHVVSLARPGGNLTGVSFLTVELTAKRVGLLIEAKPAIGGIALLVNPASPQTPAVTAAVRKAAAERGRGLTVLEANTPQAIEAALTGLDLRAADGLVVQADPYFINQCDQLAALVARQRLPAIHESRAFVAAGGLMSYGADFLDVYRLAGQMTGMVLKGANPADLPVRQPTRFDFAINLKAAKALGIDVPPILLGRADEVIE